MSVAETYLQGGRPSFSSETLAKTLTTSYSSWCWVMALPRQWHRDHRTNTVSAPAFHLLFGANADSGSGGGGGAASTTEGSHWHLLYATVQLDCRRDTDVLRTMEGCFRQVPEELHPRAFSFVTCVEGTTHERLGLFESPRCAWVAERVAEKTLAASDTAAVAPGRGSILLSQRVRVFAAAHVRSHGAGGGEVVWQKTYASGSPPSAAGEETCAAVRVMCDTQPAWLFERGTPTSDSDTAARTTTTTTPAPTDKMEHSPARLAALVWQAAAWLRTESTLEGRLDDSIPAQGNNRALLELVVRECNPLLWRTRYAEPGSVERRLARLAGSVPHPSALTGLARLRAERDEGREALKAAIGEYAMFVLPPDAAAPGADADVEIFRNVFYLQRPRGEKRAIDMDNRDPGPLTPQPIGAELHLLPDPGDALYVAEQVAGGTGTTTFTFEDFLPDEGEVLVQLGPVEGVPFDDVDGLLDVVAAEASAGARDGAISPRPVLCEGSCTGLVFPRVVFQQPTGRNEKLNPMTHAHAQVRVSAPTPAMLRLAARALTLLSEHIVDIEATYHISMSARTIPAAAAAVAGGEVGRTAYTLKGLAPLSAEALGPPSRRCGWCTRRRERLLRCTACKAVFYCSKAHQALDWRDGTHKSDCGVLRRGAEVEAGLLAPAAAAMDAASAACRTAGWSCAASLIALLEERGVYTFGRSPAAAVGGQGSTADTVVEVPVHVVGVQDSWIRDMAAELARRLPSRDGADGELPGRRQGEPRLLVTVFVEQSPSAKSDRPEREWQVAHNTVFALLPRADAPGGPGDSRVCEVPATGAVGDVWHLKGELDGAAPHSVEMPPLSSPFAAARAAPILLRVRQESYFRFVEGTDGGAARLSGLRALLYLGPPSGAGLGYLYGSLDTVARSVVAVGEQGTVALRFVDSSFMGSYRTAGALLARMDERRDAAGVAVRSQLAAQWEAVAAAGKKAKTKSPDAVAAESPGLDFIKCNTACFALNAGAADESAEVATYINSFFFDVPPPPSPSGSETR